MANKSKQEAEQGKQVINVKGGIHAGRDVIQGDQANYITTQVANIQSAAEFVTALQQVQAQIAQLKQGQLSPVQSRNLEAAQASVAEAAAEAQKPQPLGERIKTTLGEAKETMELLGGGLAAAATLGGTLGGLLSLAVKLFGG